MRYQDLSNFFCPPFFTKYIPPIIANNDINTLVIATQHDSHAELAIEGLLAHADNKWEELKKQPGISVSEEISWVMNLADNYSTVYQTFCK